MTQMEVVAVIAPRPSGPLLEVASLGAPFPLPAIEVGGLVLKPVFETHRAGPGPLSVPGAPGAPSALQRFYRVEADRADVQDIARALRDMPGIETAFVKPRPLLPIAPNQPELAAPAPDERPVPDFTPQQGYRAAAPDGVDAAAAWALPGGRGNGVSIVDIEGGWCLDHVDLEGNGGLRGGADFPELDWRNHGTAVLGVMVGEDDARGVRGLAPAARAIAYTHRADGAAGAIQRAADLLSPGDIMVLEMHSPGPRYNYEERDDQAGYIAVEWWPDTLVAVRYAVSCGIIVVGAAGNGAENLDDELYDAPGEGFPADWVNPFRRADSGAIIVGAGAPAGGAFGPARARLDFSNYGSRVDCQGWGRSVCTTGYGDLWAGSGEHEWFTAQFSGTSSASPVVAGALASLQGIARARQGPMPPKVIRDLVRNYGSPQPNPGAVSERIGSLPDLARLIAAL